MLHLLQSPQANLGPMLVSEVFCLWHFDVRMKGSQFVWAGGHKCLHFLSLVLGSLERPVGEHCLKTREANGKQEEKEEKGTKNCIMILLKDHAWIIMSFGVFHCSYSHVCFSKTKLFKKNKQKQDASLLPDLLRPSWYCYIVLT